MATDLTKVRVGLGGAVSKGLTSATAPTGTSGLPTGFADLGWLGEDGIEIELPDAGDSTPVKAWQGGATVRVIRTPSEDLPTWKFVLLENNKAAAETYFGVTITSGVSEGNLQFVSTASRPYNSYIVDIVDGASLIREYIPRGIVTEVGSHTLSNGEAMGYEVTVSGELDATKGYNFQRWSTDWKS